MSKSRLHIWSDALRRIAHRFQALHTAALFGLSGAAFALGNLLLARTMPIDRFGAFSLAVALFNAFAVFAPLGLDQLLLRYRLGSPRRLFFRLGMSGSTVGVVVGIGAVLSGALPLIDAAILALLICSGGIVLAASNGFRAALRQTSAFWLATASSWALCGIGLASQIWPMQTVTTPFSFFALANIAVALVGWNRFSALAPAGRDVRTSIPWREGVSLLGIVAIASISLQFERLVIPILLDFRDLALFSVLASVAIFPFRMVSSGTAFSLVPRLRATSDPAARRRLVSGEVRAIIAFISVAAFGILLVAPALTPWITGGRYILGHGLVLAACLNGSVKIMQALPRAVLTACGEPADLVHLNRLGWFGLFVSVIGSVAGSHWGLDGLIVGASLGSLAGSIPAIFMARRVLR